LYQILQETRQEDNRKAIAAIYGYIGMLQKYTDTEKILDYANAEKIRWAEEQKKMQELNQEALFSNHIMTTEQRQSMEHYLNGVLKECKAQWSLWKKIRYHYVLWLYR